MKFFEKLQHRQAKSLLCVGLDPDFEQMPEGWPQNEAGVLDFCRRIVDATADFAAAFKPQIAYFSAIGAETALVDTIGYIHAHHPDIPVILDAKRGDIGSTAAQYAVEAFVRYEADAATVSPYLGADSLAPWLEYADNGIFVLCHTSNAGAAALQNLECNGKPLFEHVAQMVLDLDKNQQCGLVMGATFPEELKKIRDLAPQTPFLIPGIGAQGGDIKTTIQNAGKNVLIISSRAILYASNDSKNFDTAARKAAEETAKTILSALSA